MSGFFKNPKKGYCGCGSKKARIVSALGIGSVGHTDLVASGL